MNEETGENPVLEHQVEETTRPFITEKYREH